MEGEEKEKDEVAVKGSSAPSAARAHQKSSSAPSAPGAPQKSSSAPSAPAADQASSSQHLSPTPLSQTLQSVLKKGSDKEHEFMLTHDISPEVYDQLRSKYLNQNGTVDLMAIERHFLHSKGCISITT